MVSMQLLLLQSPTPLKVPLPSAGLSHSSFGVKEELVLGQSWLFQVVEERNDQHLVDDRIAILYF